MKHLLACRGGAPRSEKKDPEASQFLSDFALMDRFGWTPSDIRRLTVFEYDATLAVMDTLSNMEKMEREKSSTANKRAKR